MVYVVTYLQRRRLRKGQIELFMWYTGYNKGDISKVLRVNNQDININYGFNVEKFRFRREIGRNCFLDMVIEEWNRLNDHIATAQTLGSFKR